MKKQELIIHWEFIWIVKMGNLLGIFVNFSFQSLKGLKKRVLV